MRDILLTLGLLFSFFVVNAQNCDNYYYADNTKHYWTENRNSINIIVQNQ